MKKHLLAGLAVLGAVSMLCGFDSAETADSVLQKMNEAEATQTGMTATVDLNADAKINLSDGSTDSSLGLSASASLAVTANNTQPAARVEGSVEYALPMLGGETITLKSYVLPDESGTMKAYAYTDNSTSGDSGWSVQVMDGLTADSLTQLSEGSAMDISELDEYGISFELAPEAAQINGTECYMLTSVMDAATLETVMQKASEKLGEDLSSTEELSQALAVVNGLKIRLVYYVDAATYLPVQMTIDMNDSDLTTINALLNSYLGAMESEGAPSTTYELVVNDLSLSVVPAYGEAEEITVPEEALAAEASGEATSLSEAVIQ